MSNNDAQPSDHSHPLTTIGVPTRNGALTLKHALESACDQDYPNLEIVISDNASEDATHDIAARFGDSDSRIRIIRQVKPLTMLQNHRAVWNEGRGKYFVWLADDDRLDRSFISTCVSALEADPQAVLAFGDVVAFTDYVSMSDADLLPFYDFTTRGQSRWRRLAKNRHSGYEIKGVLRRDILEGFGWHEHTVSPDWPLLTYLMLSGEIVSAPGARLCSGYPVPKTGSDRAHDQSFSAIERFPTAKLSWRCGLAALEASKMQGRRGRVLVDAGITFASLLWFNKRAILNQALGRPR